MTASCPKCGEPALVWMRTKKDKWWLKKDLGEGQVSKGWHDCERYKPPHISKEYCHECGTKCLAESYCPTCEKKVSVVDKK